MFRPTLLAAPALLACSLLMSSPAQAGVSLDVSVNLPGIRVDLFDPPPPVRYEIVPAPRDGWVWNPGYWTWDDDADGYVWVSGMWLRERPGFVWFSPRWAFINGGWHFEPGYWNSHPDHWREAQWREMHEWQAQRDHWEADRTHWEREREMHERERDHWEREHPSAFFRHDDRVRMEDHREVREYDRAPRFEERRDERHDERGYDRSSRFEGRPQPQAQPQPQPQFQTRPQAQPQPQPQAQAPSRPVERVMTPQAEMRRPEPDRGNHDNRERRPEGSDRWRQDDHGGRDHR